MVREHVRVVERPLPDAPLVVDQLPAVARVVTAEEPAVVVLEERVDPVRIRARDRQPDPPDDALLRHPRIARDLGPRVPAVDAFEHAAARPARRHRVLPTECLPQRHVEHVRVVAIQRDVNGTGPLVTEEDPLPAVPAVGAPEETALLARHPVLSERRDVDDVRVGRVDADLGDAVGVGEPDVFPGLAAVAAAVHAVARQDVAADARLAGADEDEVGVGFRHRDRAHRRRRDLEVGDGVPVVAAVGRLPEAAAGRAEIGFVRPALDAGDGDGAAAAVGAEVAPGVAGEEGGVENDLLGLEGGRAGEGQEGAKGASGGHRRRVARDHRLIIERRSNGQKGRGEGDRHD